MTLGRAGESHPPAWGWPDHVVRDVTGKWEPSP